MSTSDDDKGIFRSAEDWQYNACLNFTPDQSYGYIAGYRKAADTLVDTIVRSHKNQDTLVYPICFLYRHYLELVFKRILSRGCDLLGRDLPNTFTHDLRRLWQNVRSIVVAIWPEGDQCELVPVDRVVTDFSRLDSHGEAFRYAVERKGTLSLKDVRHINLRLLRDKMTPVADLLDGIEMAIDHSLDLKWDAERS